MADRSSAAQHAEQRADRRRRSSWSHGASSSQAHRSIPRSRRLPPLPRHTRIAPRIGPRSLSLRASASLMRRPARHSATISPCNLTASAASPAACITATISSTVGGSAGYRRPLLRGGQPWGKLASVACERRRPQGVQQHSGHTSMIDPLIVSPPASSWPSLALFARCDRPDHRSADKRIRGKALARRPRLARSRRRRCGRRL
jgi:hypothetical protein